MVAEFFTQNGQLSQESISRGRPKLLTNFKLHLQVNLTPEFLIKLKHITLDTAQINPLSKIQSKSYVTRTPSLWTIALYGLLLVAGIAIYVRYMYHKRTPVPRQVPEVLFGDGGVRI